MSTTSIALGTRRELFIDHYLIDQLENAELRLNHPHPEGPAFHFSKPWEGAFSGYPTIIYDQEKYRLYYRAWPKSGDHLKAVTCMAESSDGIEFTRPNLGLYEHNGSRDNNIILTCEEDMYTHNFAPMLDDRPGIPEEERYKALTRNYGLAFRNERDDQMGLFAFISSDGIHWKKKSETPVITGGKLDSLNVPFWSEHENCYLCFLREVAGTDYGHGVRSIARCQSDDFINWTSPVLMDMGDTPPEQLYTNQTRPYFRAPHIYMAFPGRFMPGRQVLPEDEARSHGVHFNEKQQKGYWNDCSDGVFMTSRGGNCYDRTFMEAFIRPGLDRRNWTSRCNYPGNGMIQTGENELSLYVERHNAQDAKYVENKVKKGKQE